METIYMDYNATTPVREEVLELMARVTRECYGNPSSVHLPGRMSRACIEDARRKVAASLNASQEEIFFTSGGSEGDNLAVKGIAALHETGHIISTCIEHSAVRRSCDDLARRGYDVTCMPVDKAGYVDPAAVEEAIRDDTILITLMWANNETGQIQPVADVAKIARSRGVPFHTDAVQAFGKIAVDVAEVPVDLLAISGHKFYAPKGVGALFVRKGVKLAAQVHGGGQERGMRSGTENVAGIAALGEACRLAVRDLESELRRIEPLRDALERGILASVPRTRVNGDRGRRVPNTTNISFDGVEAGPLIRRLDEEGFAVSGASACASGKNQPSTVLVQGMGLSPEEAMGALRFSLGRASEAAHVTGLLDVLPGIVAGLRTAGARR